MNISNKENGYTLLIVMWGLVVLTIIFVSLLDEAFLETMITRNVMDDEEINQTARSGLIHGIDVLKSDDINDEGRFDVPEDEWAEEITGELNGVEYTVNIKDAGSKLNFNYTPESIIYELDWFEEELMEEFPEDYLIADLVLVKDIFGDNFENAREIFTVNNKFNVNTDRPESLEIIMEMENLSHADSERILNFVEELQEEGRIIESMDELRNELQKHIRPSVYEQIEPYFTAEGSLNINFVEESVLEPLLSSVNEDHWEDYLDNILTYREEEGIKNLDVMEELIPDNEDRSKLIPYFTVKSNLFLIEVEVFHQLQEREDTLKVLVEREFVEEFGVEEEYQVRIIKWDV